jgi:hypothetical protein
MSLELSELRPLQALAASILFKKRRLLLILPRQLGGKTELGVRLIHDITRRPFPSSSLFLAKDAKSAKAASREKFLRIFDDKDFAVNTELVYKRGFETSCCFIKSVDKDPDRLRGGTYSFIHWSEVAFSKLDHGETITGVYDKVIQPTMTETRGYVLLESTNNGRNGWYDLWNEYERYGFHRLRVGLGNMVELGLITEARYLEIESTTHPDVFRQEYLCDWVTFQGKVYPEFGPDCVVDMPPPQNWQQTVISIDWGYSPSATACLFGYVADGVVNVFDEHYKKEELAIDTAEILKDRLARWRVTDVAATADHEADRNEELTRRGIPCTLAKKVDVLGNRVQIKELLFQKRLKINPRCVNLIRDLEAAVWHPKREGELDDGQCTWGHFDGEAALRYLVRELSDVEMSKQAEKPVSQAAALMGAMNVNHTHWSDQ